MNNKVSVSPRMRFWYPFFTLVFCVECYYGTQSKGKHSKNIAVSSLKKNRSKRRISQNPCPLFMWHRESRRNYSQGSKFMTLAVEIRRFGQCS